MFNEWLKTHDVGALIAPKAEYSPFPRASDRAAWDGFAQNAKMKDEILAYAKENTGCDWPASKATLYMQYRRTGNRRNYENNWFTNRTQLSGFALAECLQGGGAYLDDIIDGIWSILEETYWGLPAHNTPFDFGVTPDPLPDVENPFVDIFAASTGALLAYCLYLFEDQLERVSKRLVRRMRHELTERIMKPFLRHEDFWWMGFMPKITCNWDPWAVSNVIPVFLLTDTDNVFREAGIIKGLRCLDNFLDIYHEDGGCDEGTSYWNVAGGALFDCLEQLYHLSGGKIDFYGEPLVKDIGRFIYRSHIAGDYFINFADGGARVAIDRDMVYRYGRAIGDERMMSLAVNAVEVKEGRVTPYGSVASFCRYLRTVTEEGAWDWGAMPSYYLGDVWLKDVNVMAARQFPETVKGFYLAAKGGHNDENHNHNDVGSVIVYYNGKPAVIDAGVGTYTRQTFSDERYGIWTMQSQYHNLPTLNGHMQLPGRERAARDIAYEADGERAVLTLDIADAYPAEAGIESYKRSSRLIKGAGGYVELEDSYRFVGDKNALTLNVMLCEEPRVLQDGRVLITSEGAELYLTYDAKQLTACVETIEIDDARLGATWSGNLYRLVLECADAGREGTLRLRLSEG